MNELLTTIGNNNSNILFNLKLMAEVVNKMENEEEANRLRESIGAISLAIAGTSQAVIKYVKS